LILRDLAIMRAAGIRTKVTLLILLHFEKAISLFNESDNSHN